MRYVAFAVVFGVGAADAVAAEDTVFPLDESRPGKPGWAATPSWTPTTVAAAYAHTYADGVATFKASGGGRTMIWARHFRPHLDIRGLRYLTIRYRAYGLNPELFSYFLYLSSRTDSGMTSDCLALAASHLILDGRWHTMTTSLKIRDRVTTAAIRFQALDGKGGVVEIAHLALTAAPPRFPVAQHVAWRAGEAPDMGQPVALAIKRNTSLGALQQALAISDWFTAEHVRVAGVPFRVPTKGDVAIGTPVKEKETVTIPVGRRARCLWLLVGAQLSPRILTYNAWQPGDSIAQPERFSVKTVYEDGTTERQLPYCVDMAEHAIWRGLHVYEIAVDDEPVREIQVRDGMRTSAFHIVAMTAGAKRFAPTMPDRWAWPAGGAIKPGGAPSITRDGEATVFANGAGRLVVEHARGLTVTDIRGQFGVPWRLEAPGRPLLTVREEKETWTAAAFRWQANVTDARAEYLGSSAKARLTARVTVTPEAGGEFGLRLAVRNDAEKTRFVSVTFPEASVRLAAAPDELWYFIPRSCGVIGTAERMFLSPHGGKFPLQWIDFFDRKHGGGVYVSTRTLSVQHRWYEGGKRDGVGIVRIEYLNNVPLPAGKWTEYPPAVVGIHAGDWHAAFDADRTWRATWQRPQRPRLDWFRRTWHLRTHWIRTLASGGVAGLPEYNWLDPNTRKLRGAQFVDRDRREFGHIDYFHIFDWRISEKYGRWGDYGHYDEIGGLAEFRRTIKAVQAKGVRVGLYLDVFLVSRKSLVGRKHGREWVLTKQNGRPGDTYSTKDDPMYNMCVAHPGWQDYLAATCRRVAEETGCDGIYLDEGGMDLPGRWCWRKDHGHPVPGTTMAGERVLFEKVRAALPDGVALYTEYAPPDVLIPHLDGAYMMSLRTTDLKRSPGYLNISRFAFPDFKVFVIPNGGSMFDGIYDGLLYSLFNGIALYSLSWGHDAEAFGLCDRISRILKRYEDCFLTADPKPLVPTVRARVYANAFPGRDETVWTLWNGRFRTVRGPVLWVPHVPGTRYRDVWHNRKLDPRIENGRARIDLEIGPRDIGVVVGTRRGGNIE